MDDYSFIKILDFFNLSWKGYRRIRKSVKKRIVRHMQSLNLNRTDEYLKLLEKDADIRKMCFNHLTVSISRFFRDRALWDELAGEILPALLHKFSDEPKFTVWSSGCARGEEVYSFLMVWETLKKNRAMMPDLEIIATDINSEYIKMAMEGIYEFRCLKELPESFIQKYFTKIPGKNRYQIHPHLMKMVKMKHHNFIKDPPPLPSFHMIFNRNNLLTYYNFPEKSVAFSKIINTLRTEGVLIIGSREKIPDNIFCIERHPRLTSLYTKKKSSNI